MDAPGRGAPRARRPHRAWRRRRRTRINSWSACPWMQLRTADRRPCCDLFDANVCGRDVPHGKPDPDIFPGGGARTGRLHPSRLHRGGGRLRPASRPPRQPACSGLGVARLDDAAAARSGRCGPGGNHPRRRRRESPRRRSTRNAGRARNRAQQEEPIMMMHGEPTDFRMTWARTALEATADPAWVLEEHGYAPLREMGVESRFSVSNGFLGVRGARSASRGSTWVSWLHHLSWASWPRTFVAGPVRHAEYRARGPRPGTGAGLAALPHRGRRLARCCFARASCWRTAVLSICGAAACWWSGVTATRAGEACACARCEPSRSPNAALGLQLVQFEWISRAR